MKRLCVVCEGQTEAEFVGRCLAPHLQEHNLLVFASILQAKSGRITARWALCPTNRIGARA